MGHLSLNSLLCQQSKREYECPTKIIQRLVTHRTCRTYPTRYNLILSDFCSPNFIAIVLLYVYRITKAHLGGQLLTCLLSVAHSRATSSFWKTTCWTCTLHTRSSSSCWCCSTSCTSIRPHGDASSQAVGPFIIIITTWCDHFLECTPPAQGWVLCALFSHMGTGKH